MFLGDFEECKKDVISIDNVSEKTIEDIITFSYTGKIVITKENVASLLKNADFFELTDVKDECVDFLKSNLEIENVFVALHLANLLPDCSVLFETSKAFIRRNLRDVSLTENYASLDFELLENLLSEEDSNVSPELMFEAIMRWVFNNFDDKKTNLPKLLRHVDTSNLKFDSLVKSLFKDECKFSVGPKHDELVTEVLSVFSKLIMDNAKNVKTYIYVDHYYGHEIYDSTTDEWNSATFVDGPKPDDFGLIFVHRDKLYKFPSESKKGQATNMAVCNFKDKVWINTEIIIPFDISFSRVVLLNDCIYACGGQDSTSEKIFPKKNEVWRFSLETRVWQSVNPMVQPRTEPQVVALHGFIYVIGGEKRDAISITMERYDPQTDEWTLLSDLNVGEKYDEFSAVGFGDKIYLCGGSLGIMDFAALVYAYDTQTDKWTKLASMNVGRQTPLVLEHKGKIWAIGGTGYEYEDLSTVEVYDPVSDSWTYGRPMNEANGYVKGCVFPSNS